ncbi:hypothetical protein LOTGIDRAFT_162113 [Lottia gigantea]|uniref:Uncharacterized protein n=1 Tax=Lottia gigantea TaxID=225164 RepID=V4AI46_LOTGI|nr:hypothetical protein LOTGIDRAFT_162113 [Lottia gigantea]ESO93091.1 hypothetical protein LOTGIDRAFT_162113 [Lottia gigantea]
METNSSNPSLKDFKPSNFEILFPPLACLFGAIVGLVVLIINSKRGWCWRMPKIDDQHTIDSWRLDVKVFTGGQKSWPLLSNFDRSVLESLELFVNTPWELIKISLPAFLSLAFCPLTLFLHVPIIKLFWPDDLYDTTPNINDGIACFLVPAGMVYAISFGFAFQQVMAKQQSTDMYISQEVDRLHRLLTMTSKMTLSTITIKLQMFHLIKNEMVKFILYIQDKDLPSGHTDLMDIICLISKDSLGWSPAFNTSVRKSVVKIITDTPFTVGSKAPSKQRINFLQWAFLETLGYFTFLGILLVSGQSYRMELSMCIITVISISMLCYIVADMDSPFHGYFKTDLTIVKGLASRLEKIYTTEAMKMVSKDG